MALAALACLCACTPAVSDFGAATVIDGDSLEIGTASIRLYGVDAPEALQTCGEGAATWNCGRAATEKLRELVGARRISCRKMDTDSYGRTVAVCRNGSVDLSAAMAAAGLALAYRRYSDDYVDEEARAGGRGLDGLGGAVAHQIERVLDALAEVVLHCRQPVRRVVFVSLTGDERQRVRSRW